MPESNFEATIVSGDPPITDHFRAYGQNRSRPFRGHLSSWRIAHNGSLSGVADKTAEDYSEALLVCVYTPERGRFPA